MTIELLSGREHKVDYTPAAATAGGSLVTLGAKKCYTSTDLAAGERGAVAWPSGTATVRLPNGGGIAGSAGDQVDYDGTNAVAGAGFGFAAADFLATDASIEVVHDN